MSEKEKSTGLANGDMPTAHMEKQKGKKHRP
jgi:hypothetical protein